MREDDVEAEIIARRDDRREQRAKVIAERNKAKDFIFNFDLNGEVKSTETNKVDDADHRPTKNSQQDGRAVRS